MINFSMVFPIRDEVCVRGSAEYYGFAYYDRSQHALIRHQFSLGNRALSDPIEALVEADSSLELDSSKYNKFYAAAATVIRLCMNHDSPQLEVVVNSVAQTHQDLTFQLEGNVTASLYGIQADKPTFYTTAFPINERHNDYLGWRSGGKQQALYLPHEDYSAVQNAHKGLIVVRGGNTNELPIGLIGGEQLVKIAAMPDNRPD